MARKSKSRKIQTTLRLPRPLYEQAHAWVERSSAGPDSFNDLVVQAMTFYLKMLRRAKVDASFAEMANDPDFRRETEQILAEFEHSDWEALQFSERAAGTDNAAR